MTWLAYLIAWLLASVVAHRCFMVIFHMDFATRRCRAGQFWGFGLSYITLFVAALGAAMHITEGQGIAGDWLFLMSSAGLIVFDRRKRRARTAANTTTS